MSEAKTLFGMMLMFGLILLMIGAIANDQIKGSKIAACKTAYNSYGVMVLPEGGWFKELDTAVWFGQYLVGSVGTLLSPCMGMTWIIILMLIPIAVAILYLAVGSLPFT